MKEKVFELCRDYTDLQIAHYKHLHEHPELPFKEFETAKYIREALKSYGVTIAEGISGTSTVGILKGSEPGPTVAFRADIDALPVQEDTGLEYASKVPNVMHACGHDSHAATLLCFAKLLSEHRELIKGEVRFLFQCAEEFLPGGAIKMREEGAVDGCDAVFGFHCGGTEPSGDITVNIGPNSADIATYRVTIHGKGGHGSRPDMSLNPVPVACMAVTAVNQLLAEKVDPSKTGVLTVAYIKDSGNSLPNILTDSVVFGGNIRTYDHQVTLDLLDGIERTVKGISAAYGMSCEVVKDTGYHATINDREKALVVRAAADELGYGWKEEDPGLGGEDVSYFLEKVPGCFFNIGMNDPEENPAPAPHHNKGFKLDLGSLHIGLEMELATYLKYLENGKA